MIIERGAKAAAGILLLFSTTTPQQIETSTPNTPVIERTVAVLPERLKIPGSKVVEDKRRTGSNSLKGITGVIGRTRRTKVRYS